MMPVFLVGGGWRAETFPQTYGRFTDAATKDGKRRIAIVVAEEPGADAHQNFLRFCGAFEKVGLAESETVELIVSGQKPLTSSVLSAAEPTGIFVCGGLTPAYHEALCRDTSWLDFLRANSIPYGGFSAGAAVAANLAVIGGWLRNVGGRTVEIANENAGEDIELLDVRNGLGLVPFAIDTHATQWGTLSRLIHTVDAGLAADGWAIDENTMLEVVGNDISLHGIGNGYRIRRHDDNVAVEIFHAGDRIT